MFNLDFAKIEAQMTEIMMPGLSAEDLERARSQRLDVYKMLASKEFAVPYDQVTPEQRSIVKSKAYRAIYSHPVKG